MKNLTVELGVLVLPINSGVHTQVTTQVMSRVPGGPHALHEGCTQRQPLPWLRHRVSGGSSFLLILSVICWGCFLGLWVFGMVLAGRGILQPEKSLRRGAGAGEKIGAGQLAGGAVRSEGQNVGRDSGGPPLHCHDLCLPHTIATCLVPGSPRRWKSQLFLKDRRQINGQI